MPLSRNTGASASRTISATVLTDRSGEPSNISSLCTTAAVAASPQLSSRAARDLRATSARLRRSSPQGPRRSWQSARAWGRTGSRRLSTWTGRRSAAELAGSPCRQRKPSTAARLPPVSAVAAARIRLRMSSHPMTGQTLGNRCVSGLRTNSRPASAVTTPAAMMYNLVPYRSDPPTISIRPAAMSSPPIMSDEIVFPAGRNAAADADQDDRHAGDPQSSRPRISSDHSLMCPVATSALCSWTRTR